MTERESADFAEQRIRLYHRAKGRCESCGVPLDFRTFQCAHRIPQSQGNLAKYGKAIIHHDLNFAAVCGLTCNSGQIVRYQAARDLLSVIRQQIKKAKERM